MELKITNNNRVSSLNAQKALQRRSPRPDVQSQTGSSTFLEALKQAGKDANVTFSRHAEQRMNAWNHHETHNYIEELDNAMDIVTLFGRQGRLVSLPVKADDFFTIYDGTKRDFVSYINDARRV